MKKKVLITGITGQDGIFLSNELLKSNEYKTKSDKTNTGMAI